MEKGKKKVYNQNFPLVKSWLPRRIVRILANRRIETMSQLVALSQKELLCFPDLGKKTLFEIEWFLSECGYKLGDKFRNAPVQLKLFKRL